MGKDRKKVEEVTGEEKKSEIVGKGEVTKKKKVKKKTRKVRIDEAADKCEGKVGKYVLQNEEDRHNYVVFHIPAET